LPLEVAEPQVHSKYACYVRINNKSAEKLITPNKISRALPWGMMTTELTWWKSWGQVVPCRAERLCWGWKNSRPV
jgi:hypothetical protein